MSKSLYIECDLVKRAAAATDPQGYAVTLGNLIQQIGEHVEGLTYNNVVDALKRLFEQRYINLRKWDLNTAEHHDYKGKNDNDGLFFEGTFFIQRTPYSDTYLEQFVAPPEPPKRPIGFQS